MWVDLNCFYSVSYDILTLVSSGTLILYVLKLMLLLLRYSFEENTSG